MAVSVTTQTAPYVDKLVVDTSADATASADVLSGAATTFIYDMDNSDNTVPTYLKVWNHANPTVGTTEFDILLKAPAQTRQSVTITGLDTSGDPSDGLALGTALSFAATKSNTTADTTNPTNAVVVRIMAE